MLAAIIAIEYDPHELRQMGDAFPAPPPAGFIGRRGRAEIADRKGADMADQYAVIAGQRRSVACEMPGQGHDRPRPVRIEGQRDPVEARAAILDDAQKSDAGRAADKARFALEYRERHGGPER